MTDDQQTRHGEVVESGHESGVERVYRWDWPEAAGRRGLPWVGIFLVVFGALVLLGQIYPQLRQAGSLIVLAVGIAFLVSWAINHSAVALYAGAIITAIAAPGVLEGLDIASGGGLGTLALGVAFLFIAGVRLASRGGIGWQAWLGAILVAVGLSRFVLAGIGTFVWPVVIVALGVLLLARRPARR